MAKIVAMVEGDGEAEEAVPIRIASIPDLKRLADRPRDREDVEKLGEILRLKGERGEA